MILNVVLKMILRSWWRNKVFFLVSVASLALGLACTNLLMTYFVHEHGLEGRNPDRDRMFFCGRMTRWRRGNEWPLPAQRFLRS